MAYLLALTLLLVPAYALKFSIGPLPTNFLMLWVFFVWLVFAVKIIAKKQSPQISAAFRTFDRKIFILTGLFLLAGAISLFWKGFALQKLGQFVVLFLQPISIFFISLFVWRQNPESKRLLITTGYLLLALMGIYSVIQYFTLWGLPPVYWGNSLEPKRALGFFSHPNFYSLFSAPLLALLMADLGLKIKDFSKNWQYVIAWTAGSVGLGLSLSRAGWLGLGAAGLVYLFFAADKKIRKFASIIVVIIVTVIAAVPNLRWRLITPFKGERSATSRTILWESGIKAIKTSPILGLGLNGYSNNYQKFQSDTTLDAHNFPHNIFLNFWLETGIIGLISLMGLMGLLIYRGLISAPLLSKEGVGEVNVMTLGVALFLIALLSQGLLDNPYFKNDLALVFWLVLSLAYGYPNKKTE